MSITVDRLENAIMNWKLENRRVSEQVVFFSGRQDIGDLCAQPFGVADAAGAELYSVQIGWVVRNTKFCVETVSS